ncbi:hypothetical protein LMH73_005990, partial [Vibrio splendidus]
SVRRGLERNGFSKSVQDVDNPKLSRVFGNETRFRASSIVFEVSPSLALAHIGSNHLNWS